MEPNFIRAQIRAVTCHMRVGDLAGAADILLGLEAGVHRPDAKTEVQNKRSELTQLQAIVEQVRILDLDPLLEGEHLRISQSKVISGRYHAW